MEQSKISPWKEVAGWYGVLAILVGYAAVSFGWLNAQGLWFQLINASGSIGIIIVAHARKDIQPAVLNAVWLLIAAISLAQLFF